MCTDIGAMHELSVTLQHELFGWLDNPAREPKRSVRYASGDEDAVKYLRINDDIELSAARADACPMEMQSRGWIREKQCIENMTGEDRLRSKRRAFVCLSLEQSRRNERFGGEVRSCRVLRYIKC